MRLSRLPTSSAIAEQEEQAYRVEEFCGCHRIGKSKFYEEVAAGRLITFTVGRRRLVSKDAARAWMRTLEAQKPAKVAANSSELAVNGAVK